MFGFLEPVCRQVCSPSFYGWLGQYFWPELLNNGLSLITTGVIATGATALLAVGGIYYCISHRTGQVQASTTPFAINSKEVPSVEQQEEQVQRLKDVQSDYEAESATRRNATTKELPPIEFQSAARPLQHMPKQQILAAYFKTHLAEKMKYMNPGYKAEVEQAAFQDLGLPSDGMVPTDPAKLLHYRTTMKGLGLNLNY